MNRTSIISFIVILFGISGVIATTAQSQIGPPKNFVSLQPTTPGASQSGNSNISGRMLASQFVGGGAGLTNVDAQTIDGLNSTAFLQAVPNPLSLTSSGLGPTISATNTYNQINGGVGIYASSTGQSGFGLHAHSSGGNGFGVFAETTGGNATAVYGRSTGTNAVGLYGAATASSGFAVGVYGYSFSTGGVGVRGQTFADTGFAVGGRFETDSVDGKGVYAIAGAASGVNYAVYAENSSPSGYGVYGVSDDNIGVFGLGDATTGVNYGVYGQSDSASGRAVFGFAGSTTGTTYGVRGQAVSTGGYGVYSLGDFGASGTKAFRIDHPSDPENKYLLHYSSESPMPQNFYLGNVVTDEKGFAWVDLPDYFAEINANFKYQLTVIDSSDDFVMAKVTSEIVNNRFQIRSSKPGVKVSWEVKADRNDLYVREKQPKDVVEKVGAERGKYQHPELYGQPKERGMDYQAPRAQLPRSGRN